MKRKPGVYGDKSLSSLGGLIDSVGLSSELTDNCGCDCDSRKDAISAGRALLTIAFIESISLTAGSYFLIGMSTLWLTDVLPSEYTILEPSAFMPSLDLYCSRPENGVLTPVPIGFALSDVCCLLTLSLY